MRSYRTANRAFIVQALQPGRDIAPPTHRVHIEYARMCVCVSRAQHRMHFTLPPPPLVPGHTLHSLFAHCITSAVV